MLFPLVPLTDPSHFFPVTSNFRCFSPLLGLSKLGFRAAELLAVRLGLLLGSQQCSVPLWIGNIPELLKAASAAWFSLSQPQTEWFSNTQAKRQPLQQFCSLEIKPRRMELKVHGQIIQDDLQTTKAICIKSEKILIFPFPSKTIPSTWYMKRN